MSWKVLIKESKWASSALRPFSVSEYFLLSSIVRILVSFRCLRTGYMVPGLGFLPRLFSSSRAISAPVIASFLTNQRIRNDKNPLEPQCIIRIHIGLSILKLIEIISVFRYFYKDYRISNIENPILDLEVNEHAP